MLNLSCDRPRSAGGRLRGRVAPNGGTTI